MRFLSKIKHLATFGVGFYAPKVATLATFPIYARSLPSVEFALLALMETCIGFFGMLANAGVSNAMLRYYADEEEELGQRKVFTTALVLVAVGGIVTTCVISLLAASLNNWMILRSDLAKDVVHWLPIIALISVADAGNSLLQTLFRAQRKPLGFTVVTLCRVVPATLLGLYLGVWEGKGISGVLTGNVVGSVGSFLICGTWLSLRYWARPQWELSIHLLKYAAPYVPLGIVELISAKAGFICVSALGSTSMIATYSIAEKVGSLVQAAYGPIGFILTPGCSG
ncbi:lipopolysaccharide biosynthesis protein [Microvirga aerilata]|uniref:lipopolysaccharide biosynthesis protein n=1 Tax=Microvirga aerilata TaxID=670292 RepID=UPI0036318F56